MDVTAFSNWEDSDQTAHLCSLICVFSVCISSLWILENLYGKKWKLWLHWLILTFSFCPFHMMPLKRMPGENLQDCLCKQGSFRSLISASLHPGMVFSVYRKLCTEISKKKKKTKKDWRPYSAVVAQFSYLPFFPKQGLNFHEKKVAKTDSLCS